MRGLLSYVPRFHPRPLEIVMSELLTEPPAFKTLKAAYAAGFTQLRPEHYGGEQIEVKDHTLVRHAQLACSETAWKAYRRRLKPGQDRTPSYICGTAIT